MNRTADSVISMLQDHLNDISIAAHRRLGDVAGVAVTMAGQDGRPTTAGASTDLARRVDQVQYAIGFGPCLNALQGGGGAYVPDLGADPRWGVYGPAAVAEGAQCCLSVPIGPPGSVEAVAKVYAADVDGLSPDQRRLALDFAAEVAGSVGLARSLAANARELADRTSAMDTRRTIDLAVGVLMERAHCGPDEAFALLRRQSQHTHQPVFEVARATVEQLGGPIDPAAPFVAS